MSYLEAAHNYEGSWLNPKMIANNLTFTKDTFSILSDKLRVPYERFQKLSSFNKYKMIKDFDGDEPVIVMHYDPYFGHTILDTLAWISFVVKARPEIKIVLLINEYLHVAKMKDSPHELEQLRESSTTTVFNFLINLFKKANINFELVVIDKNEYINVTNFYSIVIEPNRTNKQPAFAAMISLINEHILNDQKDMPKDKKIYLSRGKVSPVMEDELDESKRYRIVNEKRLEDFLQTLGFEIVYPEDFKSFEDQIRFMNLVRVMASGTSSGLNNLLFMENGQNVIEFATPLNMGDHYEIHDHYGYLATFKGHVSVRIPILNTDAEDIIKRIKSDKRLLAILEA